MATTPSGPSQGGPPPPDFLSSEILVERQSGNGGGTGNHAGSDPKEKTEAVTGKSNELPYTTFTWGELRIGGLGKQSGVGSGNSSGTNSGATGNGAAVVNGASTHNGTGLNVNGKGTGTPHVDGTLNGSGSKKEVTSNETGGSKATDNTDDYSIPGPLGFLGIGKNRWQINQERKAKEAEAEKQIAAHEEAHRIAKAAIENEIQKNNGTAFSAALLALADGKKAPLPIASEKMKATLLENLTRRDEQHKIKNPRGDSLKNRGLAFLLYGRQEPTPLPAYYKLVDYRNGLEKGYIRKNPEDSPKGPDDKYTDQIEYAVATQKYEKKYGDIEFQVGNLCDYIATSEHTPEHAISPSQKETLIATIKKVLSADDSYTTLLKFKKDAGDKLSDEEKQVVLDCEKRRAFVANLVANISRENIGSPGAKDSLARAIKIQYQSVESPEKLATFLREIRLYYKRGDYPLDGYKCPKKPKAQKVLDGRLELDRQPSIYGGF